MPPSRLPTLTEGCTARCISPSTSPTRNARLHKTQADGKQILLAAPPVLRSLPPAGTADPCNGSRPHPPHRGDQKLFWDESNWQALCKPCHDRKTWTEDRFVSYGYGTRHPFCRTPGDRRPLSCEFSQISQGGILEKSPDLRQRFGFVCPIRPQILQRSFAKSCNSMTSPKWQRNSAPSAARKSPTTWDDLAASVRNVHSL